MFSKQFRHVPMHFSGGAPLFVAVVAVCFSMAGAAQDPKQEAAADSGMVLKLQTNEVVLDVVARDKNHNPIGDLAASEFQVFQAGKNADKNPLHILSMRVIDPQRDAGQAEGNASGFSVRSGATCALSFTPHYELAIPASLEPGFHPILIKTTRAQVTLSFRHRYYVGPTPKGATKESKDTSTDIALGTC